MDYFNKFIITNGILVIGKVTYHRDLIWDKETEVITGGGSFDINFEDKIMTFYGESNDFGKAKIEDIKKCIDEHQVYSNPLQHYEISEKYKFKYRDIYGEVVDLN